MKKILSLFLAATMAFSMSVTAFAADFKDVTESHDQYEAVETLETLNIINGYGDEIYGPNDILTRAQACTMLVRAMYGDDVHYNTIDAFKDVPVNYWARVFIDTAYRHGLMAGYGGGVFGPEDKLSYTQTARVILNALGYGALEWPVGVNTVAYELGLYDNVKVTDFEAGCTRAHAAQMIYNAFELELVKEYAGQHFGINKNFLNDILGFEKTSEYVDGHLYIAYKDLNDADVDLFITDIRSTFEKTIYPSGTNEYKFIDSTRADEYDFDWAKVDLFVNGVDVNDTTWFVNAESVIGVFDDKDNLIAIYVENEGKDYIPGAIVIGEDTVGLPDRVENKIKKDKNFDEKTSTVTYFEEDNSYVISNKIACGFIDDISRKSVWIDDVKYTFEDAHNYDIDQFVVIYYNYRDKIAGSTIIENPYHFNVKTMKYHTWDCAHYNDRANDNNWYDEAGVIAYFADTDKAGTTVRFNACNDCQAEGRYNVSIPAPVVEPSYVTGTGWKYYHIEGCSDVTTATIPYDKTIHTTQTACPTCIGNN